MHRGIFHMVHFTISNYPRIFYVRSYVITTVPNCTMCCVLPSSGSRLLLIFIYEPNPAKYVLALMKNYVLPGNITHSTYTTN